MRHETDLFGPKAPYENWEVGSPLNNHLIDHAGKRNIVFLDEFEKSTPKVWEALLLVLDKGKIQLLLSIFISFLRTRLTGAVGFYRDRRTGHTVDCRKTIWIFATNAEDPTIDRFFMQYLDGKSTVHQADAPFSDLKRKLRKEMFATFGVNRDIAMYATSTDSCLHRSL